MTAAIDRSAPVPSKTARSLALAADAVQVDCPAGAGVQSALPRALPTAPADLDEIEFLADRLSAEHSPERIVNLLRCADLAPKRAVGLDVIFDALTRLVRSESVFLRAEAYRRLAEMHRFDLRYEMRAKRELRQGLDRETGLALTRVKALLRRC
ncbi:MAG: hypothetical protein PVG24_10095 [Gammaproteobacteria bacterium]|jgi:hypothetical protein